MSLLLLFNSSERVGWYPCCCTACRFVLESFNRADGTDIDTGSSCGWTEVAGAWALDAGALETDDANAIALCDTPHPDGDAYVAVRTQVKSDTVGDLARILLDYADGNNFLFAEWKSGAGGYLRIYRRSGGSNTQLETIASEVITNAFHTFTACVSAAGVCRVSIGDTSVSAAVGSSVNPDFGLGTGGTVAGTITFDDFVATKVETGCATCQHDPCVECEEGTTPPQIQLVIAGMLPRFGICDDCDDFNATFVLDKIETCQWYLELSPWICGWAFMLLTAMDAVDGITWQLHITKGGGLSGRMEWQSEWFGGDPADCSALNYVIEPFSGVESNNCDHTNSTATITPLGL